MSDKPKKKIPFYLRRHNSSKGGKIRNLLDPTHAHKMRMCFKGTRIMPIEYYRTRLIARLRERFPTLSEAVHDFLDRRMRSRWQNINRRESQHKYLAKVRAAKGITRDDLERMFATWRARKKEREQNEKGRGSRKRSRIRKKGKRASS